MAITIIFDNSAAAVGCTAAVFDEPKQRNLAAKKN